MSGKDREKRKEGNVTVLFSGFGHEGLGCLRLKIIIRV
jgi:hypothetical protein